MVRIATAAPARQAEKAPAWGCPLSFASEERPILVGLPADATMAGFHVSSKVASQLLLARNPTDDALLGKAMPKLETPYLSDRRSLYAN